MLCIDNNGKIRYNHPKLVAVHEALIVNWMQRIQEAQKQDLDSKEYKNRELTYIPNELAKEFIKDFHQGMTQGHNQGRRNLILSRYRLTIYYRYNTLYRIKVS